MKFRLAFKRAAALSGLCAVLLLVACGDEVVSEEPLGKTVSSEAVPMLFLDDPQTTVVTDKGKFVVEGDHQVEPGQRAKIRLYKSRRRFLCVEGFKKCWRVL